MVAQPITEALNNGRKVLWLIPGGSAASVAILAASLIAPELRSNLTVTLTDERYGPLDHKDSNWQQLQSAGFNLAGARLLPVLKGIDFSATISSYDNLLEEELARADYKIGLFGIGADGHTAGILPHSPAVMSPDLAAGYEAADFSRITITPRVIAQLDEAMVFAAGANKWPAIDRLKDNMDISDQPAQALKKAARFTIFTDYKDKS